jgi:hypothetical protein
LRRYRQTARRGSGQPDLRGHRRIVPGCAHGIPADR